MTKNMHCIYSKIAHFQVEHQVVECQEVCQEVCLVALELEDPLPLVVDLDQPLKKWTNLLVFLYWSMSSEITRSIIDIFLWFESGLG